MSELRAEDLNLVLSRVPRDIRALLRKGDVYLAGGFIRSVISGEKPSDIDLFGPSKEILNTRALEFAATVGVKIHVTDNAITLLAPPRRPVQFITRWCYDDPREIGKSFDFSMCQAVIWFNALEDRDEVKKWRSACSERFYSDLAAKRLYYTFPDRNEDAGGSIMRVRKFLSKGYNIQPSSLAGVIARLMKSVNLDRVDMDDERAVARVLAGLLHEVDPLLVVDGVELGEEVHVRDFTREPVKENEQDGDGEEEENDA